MSGISEKKSRSKEIISTTKGKWLCRKDTQGNSEN